jgi:[ribosomal protein S5]-alanine N-acetyltransferase
MNAVPEIVETGRLVLRTPSEEHAEAIAGLMTPGISRWLGSWPSPVSADEVRQRIASAPAAREAGTEVSWLVHLRETADVVGWIRVARPSDRSDRGELGYWFGEAFHGRGYATEAARAVLTIVFERWGLAVVEAGAQLDNVASFVVMKKLGMTPASERMVWTSSRDRNEPCRFFEITRTEFDAVHIS